MSKTIADYLGHAQYIADQVWECTHHLGGWDRPAFSAAIYTAAVDILAAKYKAIRREDLALSVNVSAQGISLEARNLKTGLALCGALPDDGIVALDITTWGYKVDAGTFTYDTHAGLCFMPTPALQKITVKFTINNEQS